MLLLNHIRGQTHLVAFSTCLSSISIHEWSNNHRPKIVIGFNNCPSLIVFTFYGKRFDFRKMFKFLYFLFIFAILTTAKKSTIAQQAYCWDECQMDCPKVGPRLCPPETILTYYDCCLEGCCQYIKWPNLLFLLFIIFLLLAGCCCCAFFLITDARQRMFQKQQQRDARERNKQLRNQLTYPPGKRPFQHKKHSTIV